MRTDSRTLFDAFLMVDWSASSRRKHGRDSIWYCLLKKDAICALANPATRDQASVEIQSLLLRLAGAGQAVLVGFDFPYGYPSGLSRALGLACEDGQPWRAIWREWARLVEDQPDNRNNRFEAAAALNERLPPPPGPFWGRPGKQVLAGLSPRKPGWERLAERRLVETRVRTAQPVWKLTGAGSVGSQAILGIPRLEDLRSHPEVEAVSRVWPFEWSAETKQALSRGEVRVIYAEVYPSLIMRKGAGPEMAQGTWAAKDAAQVWAIAHFFASADATGELEQLLDEPLRLPEEQRCQVLKEEGWILGVRA